MSEILTIGAFLQDLNIPGLKKQSAALSALKSQISMLFTHKQIPTLEDISAKFIREKFIRKVVADGLEFYYEEFKKYIQHEYAPKFREEVRGKLITQFK